MADRRKPTYSELLKTIEQLKAHIAEQDKRIEDLERKLAAANKNSRNSSKPPSSDITSPPATHRKPGRPKKRRIGGQKGHPRHESDLSLEDADHVEEFHADQILDDPSLDLVPAPEYGPKIIYQYEFVDTPVVLILGDVHKYINKTPPPSLFKRLSEHPVSPVKVAVTVHRNRQFSPYNPAEITGFI